MKLLKRLALVALNLGLLVLLLGMLVHDAYGKVGPDRFVYGKGNADAATRAELLDLMNRFAEGYAARNGKAVDSFVEGIFVKDDPLILGTLPREVYRGTDRVKDLIRSDWESWGNCRFQIAGSELSSRGDVAWIATRGSVAFDLSPLLVVPLRLTAVALRSPEGWRMQRLQFQFDVDLSRVLLSSFLLLAWLVVNLLWFAWELWRLLSRGRKAKA